MKIKKNSFDKHGFCSLAMASWDRAVAGAAGGDRAPGTSGYRASSQEAGPP